MDTTHSMMTFPCDFLIKIIGKNTVNYVPDVTRIVHKHLPDTPADAIREQPSQQGNYLAIRVTVRAIDQKTLDALYLELTQHPDIKMVL